MKTAIIIVFGAIFVGVLIWAQEHHFLSQRRTENLDEKVLRIEIAQFVTSISGMSIVFCCASALYINHKCISRQRGGGQREEKGENK